MPWSSYLSVHFSRPSGYNCIAAIRQMGALDRESNPGQRGFHAISLTITPTRRETPITYAQSIPDTTVTIFRLDVDLHSVSVDNQVHLPT